MATPHVYIAGRMRGLPYFNFDAFYDAEVEVFAHFGEPSHPSAKLVVLNSGALPGIIHRGSVTLFNPARYDHETIGPSVNDSPTGDLKDIEGVSGLRHALGRDLAWIAEKATHIYLLDGWEKSSGARAEKALADALGLEVMYQTEPVAQPTIRYLAEPTLTVGAGALTTEWVGTPPVGYGTAEWNESINKPLFPTGEVRVTSLTGGEKGSKPARFDLIPAGPLKTLAELYGKGAIKYDDNNWRKGYDWSLSFAALNRHLWAFWNGEDNDPEHGLPHLSSVAWHAFALMEWANTHPEFDNRPKA